MAKGKRGGGNRGSRGGGTRGRTLRVIGATKKKRVGRPRKVPRALTAGALGLPPGLRTPAPEPIAADAVTEPDDIEEQDSRRGDAPKEE